MTQVFISHHKNDAAGIRKLSEALGIPPRGAGQTRALLKPIETILSDAPRLAREHFLAATREALRLDATPTKPRRQHKPRHPMPDGLRTAAQAAAKLGCSIKTLNGYVSTGALPYVPLGHGKKRRRKMFTDLDLDNFIATQTRKVTPCPSTAGRARPTGTSTFTGEVIDFTGPRKPRTSAKPRK
jgi:hypothetical protein